MNVLEKSIALNDAIESKFKPLNWVDITTYEMVLVAYLSQIMANAKKTFLIKWWL